MMQHYDESIERFNIVFNKTSSLGVLEQLVQSLDKTIAKEVLLGNVIDFRKLTKKPLPSEDLSVLLMYYGYVRYPSNLVGDANGVVLTEVIDTFRLGCATFNIKDLYNLHKSTVTQYDNLITKLKGE